MVKKLKNKRKKFNIGGSVGNVGPDIREKKLGGFSLTSGQLTTYINPPKNPLKIKRIP